SDLAGDRLDLRQRRMIAIDGARARVDKSLHTRIARRHLHVEEARYVRRRAGERIVDRARHAAERRLVQNDVDAGAGALASIERADVALDEADAHRQVLALAGGEVVEADDGLLELEQLLG